MNAWVLFFGLLAIAGVVTIAGANLSRRRGEASASWPSVTGRVESSEIVSGDSSDNPAVHYRYQVGGRSFSGRKICFGLEVSFLDEAAAQSYIDRYPAGSAVTVYYDPDNPRAAVLEPGLPPHNSNLRIAGIAMSLIGCLGVLVRCALE